MDLLPTKRNLLLLKRNLKLVKQGHDLLEKKHKILLLEQNAAKRKAAQIKHELTDALTNAKQLLVIARAEVGDKPVNKICGLQPQDTNELPPYSLWESTVSLDEAFFAWQKVKILKVKHGDAELAVQRISVQLKKTAKRAAALKSIQIPFYESRAKYISNQLEEQERDELARIKATP
ncbi:MAG: V-type ATP synthase subunit D [Firmicutes bacterium]|nr:V-type ATP synthase subunit D [Bacillota bacterium]